MRDDRLSDDRVDGARRDPGPSRPASDREVPLGPPAVVLCEAVHRWLDGEATEDSARRSPGAGDVDFWKRLDGELARRRRLTVPDGFVARVMAALD